MQALTSGQPSLDELLAQVVAADESGQPLDRQALVAAHPEHAAELAEFLTNRDQMQRLAAPLLRPVESAGQSQGHERGKIRYFGDYELLDEIAAGGMGIVYKARQVSLNRIVAVKMILRGTLATEDDVKRFRAEAEAAGNLQHPGIVAIHEVGTHEGQHYFSMDFVEGQSLAELPRERPIASRLAAEYVRDAADAVHYAHEQGTLHRDLKPSNILIDRKGRVRITDFGLAKQITGNSDLTLTGQVLGTPSYMPPEQAMARRALIGPASDVYSLGAVLYELLAGRPPFRGESPAETLRQVETLEPIAPGLLNPAAPRDLETICLKCLEKEPHKRYLTAQQLSDDLGRFLRHEPILARPISRPARAWRWCRRNPVVAGLSAAVLLLLVATSISSSVGLLWARHGIEQAQKREQLEQASQVQRALDLLQGPGPDFVQSEQLFSAAIARHPDDAALYAGRALARFEQGQLPASIADAQESLRLKPSGNAATRQLLVEAAWEAGDDELARQECQALQELHASTSEALAARCLLDPLDPAALEQLSQAIEHNPLNARLRYHRAYVGLQLTHYRTSKRHFDQALADLEWVIAARPFDRRARVLLVSLLTQYDFLADESVRPLQRAKALLDKWLGESPDDISALMLAALVHLKLHEPERTLEFCRRGRLVRLTRPEFALLEGDALMALRRFSEAENAYASLAMLLGSQNRPLIPLSPMLIAARRARLAIDVRSRASAAQLIAPFTPSPTGATWSYHEWRALADVTSEPLPLCDSWRSVAPECPGPYEVLAIAEDLTQDPIVRYSTAIKLAPSLRSARRERGKLLATRGAHREALADFETFAVYFPEDLAGLHELASFLVNCPELSLRDLLRARELAAGIVARQPRRGETLVLLAQIELQLENHVAALKAIDSAFAVQITEDLRLMRADTLIQLRRFQDADEAFQSALQMRSAADTSRHDDYVLRMAAPNHGDAKLYRRALDLAGKAGAKQNVSRGIANYRNGEFAKALADLKDAPAEGGYFRTMALWQTGDREAAWRTYQDLSRESATKMVLLDPAQGRLAGVRREAAELLGIPLNEDAVRSDIAGRHVQPGDWPQWGGWAGRNNVSSAVVGPLEWVPGEFDRKTGAWKRETSRNVKWVTSLGSQTYGNPVVANDKIFVGTNNSFGYLKEYPPDIDLGVLLCLRETDGSFLWQLSCPKLPTGRVHDWPLMGVCSAPLAEGDRLWLVTNRGELLCLDAEGFLDGEDDGPDQGQQEWLFQVAALHSRELDGQQLAGEIHDVLRDANLLANVTAWVRVDEPGKRWAVYRQIQKGRTHETQDLARLELIGDTIRIQALAPDGAPAGKPVQVLNEIWHGHGTPEVLLSLNEQFVRPGIVVPQAAQIRVVKDREAWEFDVQSAEETAVVRVELKDGYYAAERRRLNWPSKQQSADVVWRIDMMKELGVSQHNMCTCAPTAWGNTLFVCTSNGVDDSHLIVPKPEAPSFLALDKQTGEILWTDNSPGKNIQHGQWSSPTVGVIGGVPQVIFAGGDGWLYAFHAEQFENGKPQLLWKFDTNPKDALLELGGRGTRNEPFAMPVIYDGLVYVTTGQDPEHGEGDGHLWCIDPTRRGDISQHLAVNIRDRTMPLPHRRIQAVVASEGDLAIDNPNSGVIWHYSGFDSNGDGQQDFEEGFHRSIASVVVRNDVLFAVDFAGLGHCLNAKTGQLHWTYDFLAAVWATPLVIGDRVYVGDEDGEMVILRLHPDPYQIVRTIPVGGAPFVHPDPLRTIMHPNSAYTTPVMANGVFYLATTSHLLAIVDPAQVAASVPAPLTGNETLKKSASAR